jgi:hypothetical protein
VPNKSLTTSSWCKKGSNWYRNVVTQVKDGMIVPPFEELSTQILSSGVGYLAGVTKLHSLVAPHASLVKAYRNHHQQQSEVATVTAANIGSNTNINDIVKMVTSKMLAVRLEKRLAIERREILREMIRLEEMERDDGGRDDDNNHVFEDSKSNQRKRIE